MLEQNTEYQELLHRLSKLMKDHGIAQKELAVAVRRSQPSLSRLLKGKSASSKVPGELLQGILSKLKEAGRRAPEVIALRKDIDAFERQQVRPSNLVNISDEFRRAFLKFAAGPDKKELEQLLDGLRKCESTNPQQFVEEAGMLLQTLKAKKYGLPEYRQLAHRVRKALSEMESPAIADFIRRKSLTIGWRDEFDPDRPVYDSSTDSSEALTAWHDRELIRSKAMIVARSRMAPLRWPSPYQEGWLTFTSPGFNNRFTADSSDFSVDPRLVYKERKSNDQAGGDYEAISPTNESGSLGDNSHTGPGLPEHRFFGDHCFLIDPSNDAVKTLLTRKVEVNDVRLEASHRLLHVVPRFLRRLISAKALAYDGEVTVSDVAPTSVNETLRLSKAGYFSTMLGTYSVGVDCYGSDGRRDYDGLNLVAEDGRWLLLRSNHSAKACFVCVALVSKDSELIITLGTSNAMTGDRVWTPTASGFVVPEDFSNAVESNQDSYLANGIVEAAKRILLQRMPFLGSMPHADSLEFDYLEATKRLDVSLAGTALDAALGLQLCFFCVAKTEWTADEIQKKSAEGAEPIRTHHLVEDNPKVSLAEMFGQPRYRNCEQLRCCVFTIWRWMNEVEQAKKSKSLQLEVRSGPSNINSFNVATIDSNSGDLSSHEPGKKQWPRTYDEWKRSSSRTSVPMWQFLCWNRKDLVDLLNENP